MSALRRLAGLVLILAAGAAAAREQGRPRRVETIDTIVIHTVGGPSCAGGKVVFTPVPPRDDDAEAWQRTMRAAPVADAHFVIGRAGRVLKVIPVDQIANHTAGANQTSIGIELVNRGDGTDAFPPRQIAALVALVRDLRVRFPLITTHAIVGHRDLDKRTCPCGDATYRRRQDPGDAFPMSKVKNAVRAVGGEGWTSRLPVLEGPAPAAACLSDP